MSLVVEETSQIPYAMERWGGETRRPVLSDLTYQFSGVDAASVYPATLTHLYLDRPLTLYARVPADMAPTAFQIIGRSGGQQRDMVFPLALSKTEPGTDEIRSQWVRHRLYEWIGRYTARQHAPTSCWSGTSGPGRPLWAGRSLWLRHGVPRW